MNTDIIDIIDRLLDERMNARIIPPCISYHTFLDEVRKVVRANYEVRRGLNEDLIYFKNEQDC